MKRVILMFYCIPLILSLTACSAGETKPSVGISTLTPPSQIMQDSENPIEAPSSRPMSKPPSESPLEKEASENPSQTPSIEMLLKLTTQQGETILFSLNNSSAAKSLYEQLPLSLEIDNYSNDEKIFYPPEKLDTRDTPLAKGPAGTLAYYAPWGDVAIYYGDCGGANGLYQLGEVVSGSEYISQLSGVVQLEAASGNMSSAVPTPPAQTPKPSVSEEKAIDSIQITVGNTSFSATLEENEAGTAFAKLLQNAPIRIAMSDYSGFEKVGSLGTSLPESNRQMTAQAGDIILYNGNQICVFYGSNSWSYTRLGKVDNLSGFEEALGSGDVTLTFSLK